VGEVGDRVVGPGRVVSDHVRVLDIVQTQLRERQTEGLAGYGLDAGRSPAGAVGATRQAHSYPRWPRPAQPLNGENCTVFLTDVVEFGTRTRTDRDRLLIREALFKMTQDVMQGIPDAQSEDRGDGFLTVVPPNVPTASVLDRLLKQLPGALELHNSTHASLSGSSYDWP
jgi:hypothetical protein